jgi:hypothetical protein
MFEDAFYPYNEKRALRAIQLGPDCVEYVSQMKKDEAYIDTLLEDANEAIVRAYQAVGHAPVAFQDQMVDLGDGTRWCSVVVAVAATMVAASSVDSAVSAAIRASGPMFDSVCGQDMIRPITDRFPAPRGVSEMSQPSSARSNVRLVEIHSPQSAPAAAPAAAPSSQIISGVDDISRAILTPTQDSSAVPQEWLMPLKDVSSQTSPPLPGWLDGLRIAGDIAAALVIALAVDAVFSSFNGAMRRSRLREMIHELIEPRIELKRRNMVAYQVKTTLRSIIDSLNAMKLIPGITSK